MIMQKLITFIIFITFSFTTFAVRKITINEGHIDPMPIAINFFNADSNSSRISKDIRNVISQDLASCNYFKIIPSGAFIEYTRGVLHNPLFASWRQIGAQFLLNAEVKQNDNNIEVSFIFWDTTLEKAIHKQILELPTKLWRRSAHKISDSIYEKITGDKGYFDTKIAYISESGPPMARIKKLAVMDFDGKNNRLLTDGKDIVLTPRFSPKADKILYMSYIDRTPRVYMVDIGSGKKSVLGDFPGMSFAPKFSPDGYKALMSVAKNGATNILEIDLKTKKITKITNTYSINTSPSYSPDGRKIAFNSNRSGTSQIYIMDSDGSNIKRISFNKGSYMTPVWSPRGDYIAFTKIRGGFAIGVMRPDGTGERTITRGHLVEGPTWSPSGSLIMFTQEMKYNTKKENSSKIYYIDATGNNLNILKTPTNASDPEWSNLL